jgi:lipopolysaccharide export system protein LptC
LSVSRTDPRDLRTNAIVSRRVRAHSRTIHLLRWLLPSAIVAILAVLGVFVGVDALHTQAARPRETPTQIRMVNPHFLGRDEQGRAFNLSARQARRDDNNLQQVFLDAPVMTLDVDGQRPSTLTADNGVYREDTRLLKLTGHVRVDDSRDSTVGTDEAIVDTRAGTINGRSALNAKGPTGALSAGSYTATDKGDHLILRGGVHATMKGR